MILQFDAVVILEAEVRWKVGHITDTMEGGNGGSHDRNKGGLHKTLHITGTMEGNITNNRR